MDHRTDRMVRLLEAVGACRSSLLWLSESGAVTRQEAWDRCTNSDWLRWYLGASRAKRYVLDMTVQVRERYQRAEEKIRDVLHEEFGRTAYDMVLGFGMELELMQCEDIRRIVPKPPLLKRSPRPTRGEDDIPF